MNNLILPHQAKSLTDEEYAHYLGLGLIAVVDHQRLATALEEPTPLTQAAIDEAYSLRRDLELANEVLSELEDRLAACTCGA